MSDRLCVGTTSDKVDVATKMVACIFKKDYTLDCRKAESSRVLNKYPDKLPVICEKHESGASSHSFAVGVLDKKKYLVPCNLTLGQFIYVIRKRLQLSADTAIFLFVGKMIPHTASLMSDLYHRHKDTDGFLYMNYAFENVFGAEN